MRSQKEGITNQSDGGQRFPGFLLQRKCDCGNHTMSGECDDCVKKQTSIQRKTANGSTSAEAPSIVHEVLRSTGQPLDASMRTFMEPRFGHDFSHVRVHADAKAAQSARSVNALAYTVGHDIVLGDAAKASNPWEHRKTLAHELTHVVQQSKSPRLSKLPLTIGSENHPAEHEAERMAERVMTNQSMAPVSANATPAGVNVIQRIPAPGCTATVAGVNNAEELIDRARLDATSRVTTTLGQVRSPSSRILRLFDWHFHCPSVSEIVDVTNALTGIASALPTLPVTCVAASSPECATGSEGDVSSTGLEACPAFFSGSDESRSAELIATAALMAGRGMKCIRREACYDDFTIASTRMITNAYSFAYFAFEASGFTSLPQPSVIPCRPIETGFNVIVPADAADNPSSIRRLTGFEHIPRGAEIVSVFSDRSGKYFIYRSGLPGSRVYMPGERERYYLPNGLP